MHYTVVYTWNGFFAPITNTEDSKLNLVHAGDLIKLGFGLNGDRGLNVLAHASPSVGPVACPSWTPHTVPAGGAGTTAGPVLRRLVGPLHVRVADRRVLGRHLPPVRARAERRHRGAHAPTFMFFA